MKLKDLKVGDKVLVKSNFGSGPAENGVVENIDENIKNGMEGIDYILDDGSVKWAYIEQIIRKIS